MFEFIAAALEPVDMLRFPMRGSDIDELRSLMSALDL
jgi:hypothetical protein